MPKRLREKSRRRRGDEGREWSNGPLDWLVEFALGKSVENYPSGELKRLQSQITNFVWTPAQRRRKGRDGRPSRPKSGPLPMLPFFSDSPTATILDAVRNELRQLLEDLADCPNYAPPHRLPSIELRGPIRIGVTNPKSDEPGSSLEVVHGSLRDLMLLRAVNLLAERGANPVARCAVSDCRRVFARGGRREYCSRRCRNRENSRKFRASLTQ